ncbi:LPS-assembly protein LptD [Massilia sp. Leaf139]|uniref:LPS-assembly protein LptD n=1 Tax=Massilia sp. Leaf139 TaxID=1736272 RepID=UPI0006F20A0A|nr:LPS-assembly protein LptD [Massilia sp. Leaf139]KQQ87195.1 OstA organic solvent tolerance protein [Massilia sp. Leaf139]
MSWFTALPFPRRRAVALSALVTVASGPLHAQVAPATSHADEQDLPVTVRAEEIGGRPDREINLNRNVEITRGQSKLTADTACYLLVEDEVTASGNVNMWRFGDRYQGDTLQLNMSTGRGYVTNPQYKLQMNNAQGRADRIDFLGEDQALVQDGTYSTCEGPDPDWYLKASTLRLDSGRDVGTAGKTIIYFKDVPILGTPALSFSLSGARRSGWLPATLGFGSKGKSEVMVPYYFNIAPNRDLTVYPRMMFDRGLQLGATARYIGETGRGPYGGETHIEALRDDRITKTDRWRFDSTHNQTLAPGWSYGWNLHGASDDEYPSDFSPTVATSAERQLVRDVYTGYSSQYWSLTARAQNIQVLQEPAAVADPRLAIPRPYDRLPQINFHTGRYDVKGFDWAIDAEATRFSHPTFDSGNRLLAVSQVSYPFIRPGYFVTPKLMLHATKYNMDSSAARPGNLSRTLPIFSVDSGMVFERDAKLFGSATTQTLEPRLFYVRTPYKNQEDFPVFDTAETGFSYAQLFTENRYIGGDRVSDANQVTAALVSRFIEPDGAERLRMAIAQRFYFDEPRVGRENSTTGIGRSDLLLAASGRIINNWNFDSSVQYDANDKSVFAQNHGVRWTPGPMKVLNAEYRYVRDSFRNADVSGQWPLSKRWYGVGRVSYSLRDHKLLDSLLGLEYKADCWVFRLGAQRFVTTAQATSTSTFFQLELNGLSRLGVGNPLESFYKSIPGYTRLNSNVGRP